MTRAFEGAAWHRRAPARITYSNSGASDSEIFRIDADGSHARQLTHNRD